MVKDIYFIIVFLAVLLLTAPFLGRYMAAVFEGRRNVLSRVAGPLERFIYRLCRIDESAEMSWKQYSLAFLLFNGVGFVALFLLQLLQGHLPLNPHGLGAVRWDTALNTTISFVTNTNWQAYGGETTMSYLTQMLGMTVQNFVSAAAGIAVLLPLIRAFTSRMKETVGNFWVDMTRSVLYILLPLSIILSLAPRVPGGRADLGRLRKGAHPRRRRAGHRGGAGRIAGRDQAARLERGRFLQRQFRAPLREPRLGHELPRDVLDPAHPCRIASRHGEDDRKSPAGLGHLRRHGGPLPDRARPFLFRGMADKPDARQIGRHQQHGRERGPLRHRLIGALGRGDHGDLERLGEQHARQHDAPHRARLHVQYGRGGGDLRGCRRRPDRHAHVRDPRALPRGTDDRAHTGVPGKEARIEGDDHGGDRRRRPRDRVPHLRRHCGGHACGPCQPQQRRPPRSLGDTLCLLLPCGQQRLRLRGPQREHGLL